MKPPLRDLAAMARRTESLRALGDVTAAVAQELAQPRGTAPTPDARPVNRRHQTTATAA